MMEKEIWRDVVGYDGLYKVSNQGRVKSLARKKGCIYHQEKILRFNIHQKGYLMVELCKNGIFHKTKVHRIVAQAFIPNTEHLPIINHIDENPANNRVDNLEWCTYSHNNTYNGVMDRRRYSLLRTIAYREAVRETIQKTAQNTIVQ